MSIKKENIQEHLNKAKEALDKFDYKQSYELYVQAEVALGEPANDDVIDLLAQKAMIQSTLAIIAGKSGEFSESLKRSEKAVSINEKIGDKKGVAQNLGNMAIVYRFMSDFSKAIEFHQKALTLYEEAENKEGVAANLGNMGTLYFRLSDFSKAIEFHQKALAIHQESGDKRRIGMPLSNIGAIYVSLADYSKALEYLQKALTIHEQIGDKRSVADNLGNIGVIYYELSDYPKALEFLQNALNIHKETGNKQGVAANLVNIGGILMKLSPPDYKNSEEKLKEALELCRSLGIRNLEAENLNALSELYRLQERWKEADEHYQEFHKTSAEIFTQEVQKQSQNFDHQRKIQNDERDRQVKLARHQEQEKILHNILPANVAERILNGEEKISDTFQEVTIFFSDIVGFTKMSSEIRTDELVELLNNIFEEFDRIAEKYNVQKVKTIGDAYMAVTGTLDSPNKDTLDAANFALEVNQAMKKFKTPNGDPIQIRVGLHSGAVVAGIIGIKMFTYDMWGDTVNVASRMESSSEPGKIHCSQDFVDSLSSIGDQFTFEQREAIEVKGKGKMKTFFLSRF